MLGAVALGQQAEVVGAEPRDLLRKATELCRAAAPAQAPPAEVAGAVLQPAPLRPELLVLPQPVLPVLPVLPALLAQPAQPAQPALELELERPALLGQLLPAGQLARTWQLVLPGLLAQPAPLVLLVPLAGPELVQRQPARLLPAAATRQTILQGLTPGSPAS